MARIRGSSAAILRGVKPRFTRLRIGPCAGGSIAISEREVTSSGRLMGSSRISSTRRAASAPEKPVPGDPAPGTKPERMSCCIAVEEKSSGWRRTWSTSL